MEEISSKKSYRHFFYFLFGQEFSLLGSSIVYFVISWWIADNPIYLSLASVLYILPQIIIAPIAGVLVDRLNRKHIIISIDAIQALVTFGLFLLFLFDFTNVWLVLSVNTIRSVLQAFHVPTFNAIIPSMVPKNKLNRANAIDNVFSSFIYLIGPILGGILLLILPIELIFMIDIITFITALIPVLLITIPSVSLTTKEERDTSFFHEFKLGLQTVKAVPGLLSLIFFAMIINFLWRPFNVLLPFFIKEIHNGNPINLAFVSMFISIANITGGIINAFKKEYKHKTFIMMFGTIIIFIGYSFLIIAPIGHFIVIGIGLFIQGLSFNFIIVNYATLIQSSVPSDKVGRIVSIDHSLTFAIIPIGSFLSGPLAVLIGITNLYLFSIVIGIAVTILIWILTDIHKLDYIGKAENQI